MICGRRILEKLCNLLKADMDSTAVQAGQCAEKVEFRKPGKWPQPFLCRFDRAKTSHVNTPEINMEAENYEFQQDHQDLFLGFYLGSTGKKSCRTVFGSR